MIRIKNIKQVGVLLIITIAMSIDATFNPDNFWLDTLTKLPKWLAILGFMKFKEFLD